jgi:zinc transport system substrate-binding protein
MIKDARADNHIAPFSFTHHASALVGVVLCLLLIGCNKGDQAGAPGVQSSSGDSKILVFVSILPQAFFAERIGGEHAEVEVLVAPGQSPHTYEPTPLQMAKLARAKALFTIGMPYEQAVARQIKASFPNIEIVDTRQGVPMRKMQAEEAESAIADAGAPSTHDHAEEAAGQPDPHIWLNPKLVKIQAKTIADALSRLDPPHAAQYAENLKSLDADLDATDQKIAQMLAPYKGEEFMVFHPAYGYFADAYGLKQISVEVEGKEPEARQLGRLIERARRDNIRVIFIQPQFSAKSAQAVARSIGGKVVPIDDLSRDYLNNLVLMAESIREGLVNKGVASQ